MPDTPAPKPDTTPTPGLTADCDRVSLLHLATIAGRAASKSAGGITAGLRLMVAGGEIILEATDLELHISARMACLPTHEGSAIVGAKLFVAALKAMPGDHVSLTMKSGQLVINGRGKGKTKYKLSTFADEDFPAFPPMSDNASAMTLEPGSFGVGLDQVVTAVATDDLRPVLTGALWEVEGEVLRMVATDSYRLAMREMEIPNGTTEQAVIVPGKFMEEVGRLIEEESVMIRFSDNSDGVSQVQGIVGDVVVTSRLIEGEFPRYRQLVPAGHSNVLKVDREELLDAIKRMAIVAQDSTPLKIRIKQVKDGDGGEWECKLTAVEVGVGEAEEVLEGFSYAGEETLIAFNPRFLYEAVEKAEGDKIRVELATMTKPGLVRGEGYANYLSIVMPVRIKD